MHATEASVLGGVVSTVVALVIGLVAGLATGFYFERRAKLQNRKLEGMLRDAARQNRETKGLLREVVLSGGGEFVVQPAVDTDDLRGSVTAWVVKTQDASGRVNRRAVVAHFAEEGADPREVQTAIAALCSSGVAKQEGEWLQLT